MMSLYTQGKRPSKMEIMYYSCGRNRVSRTEEDDRGTGVTCRMSLKSCPASFFMAETLSPNCLIVPLLKVGTL